MLRTFGSFAALMLVVAALHVWHGTTRLSAVIDAIPRAESVRFADTTAIPFVAFLAAFLLLPKSRRGIGRKPDQQEQGLRLFVDGPIGPDDEDLLGRAAYVQVIEAVVRGHRTDGKAIVLAIDGGWGTGKSSVVNLAAAKLNKYPRIAIARFHPWHYESLNTLVEALLGAITFSGPPQGRWWQRLLWRLPWSGWRRFVGEIESARKGLLGQALRELRISLPWISFGVALRSRDPVSASLERAGNALANSGLRVVLLTEDLDRLSQEQARRFFVLLFSLRQVSGLTIVLPLDMRKTEEILGADKHLLERLIDVPLPLPAYEGKLVERFFLRRLKEVFGRRGIYLSSAETSELEEKYRSGIGQWCQTLRRAKHLLNAMEIALELSGKELNPIDLVLIETIRLADNRAYSQMLDLAGALTDAPDPWSILSHDQRIAHRRELLTPWLKSGAPELNRLVEALFPGILSFAGGGSVPHVGFEQEAEMRMASWVNFNRYFLYRPEIDDLPNSVADGVIRASQVNADAASTALRKVLDDHGAKGRQVFNRLMHRARDVSGDAAVNLGVAIARTSDQQSDETDFLWGSQASRSRVLVYQLANRVENPTAILARWIEESASLEYAAEVLGFLNRERNHVFEKWEDLDEEALRAALFKRAGKDPMEITRQKLPARVLVGLARPEPPR